MVLSVMGFKVLIGSMCHRVRCHGVCIVTSSHYYGVEVSRVGSVTELDVSQASLSRGSIYHGVRSDTEFEMTRVRSATGFVITELKVSCSSKRRRVRTAKGWMCHRIRDG